MLTVVRDQGGRLLACCEWWLVNDLGVQDWVNGRYVWVEQLELSPWESHMAAIRQMIRKIESIVPKSTVAAYWVRRDRTAKELHAFSRNQLMRFMVRENSWKEVVA